MIERQSLRLYYTYLNVASLHGKVATSALEQSASQQQFTSQTDAVKSQVQTKQHYIVK